MTETRVAGNDFGWALEQLWNGLDVMRPEWKWDPACKLTLVYSPALVPRLYLLIQDPRYNTVYREEYVARDHELLAKDWMLA